MAKFMERHDRQFVLIANEGDHLATLNKLFDQERWVLHTRNAPDDCHSFASPVECCDWLNTIAGLKVELVLQNTRPQQDGDEVGSPDNALDEQDAGERRMFSNGPGQ